MAKQVSLGRVGMIAPEPPQTIATRFAASLSDYVGREEYQPLIQSMEMELQLISAAALDGRNLGDGCRDLLQVAGRAMVKQSMAETIRPILFGASAKSESAIELAMALAVGIAARANYYAVMFDFGNSRVFGDADGEAAVRIQQQVPISSYRADLLVSMQYAEDVGGDMRFCFKQIAVECDGFDHHDRTRDQAEHDRERDRAFQAAGLGIFRYAGSELWADVFRAAEQVIGYLRDGVRQQALRKQSEKKPMGKQWPVEPSLSHVGGL